MQIFSGLEEIVRSGEPLARHTWLRIGGEAEFFAEPHDPDQLATLVARCAEHDIPLRVLGRGSNLLVRDSGAPGVVVRPLAEAFSSVLVREQTVIAGGAAPLSTLIATSVREGLGGLENLVGIPGSVGGALHGNSGAGSVAFAEFVSRVTLVNAVGEIETRDQEELQFGYRSSGLGDAAVVSVEFELDEDDPAELTRHMQKLWILKRANQPVSEENICCVFKDPKGGSAAQVLDQAGLKGMRVGGAEVSDRHANFIIARDKATSDDVMRLIDLMRDQALDRVGEELEQQLVVW